MSDPSTKRVTVVGGGFSGAIFAHHLLQLSPVPVLIEVAEEREHLGEGVAYSASEPHQTTNIPAPRMSVFPEDRSHFARWLEERETAGGDEADHYPQRSLFGAYVEELLHQTRLGHPASRLRHHRTRVETLRRSQTGFELRDENGGIWQAETVALATGNPVPLPPPPLARLQDDPRVILDPWAPGALTGIDRNARVLIVGIGLSMGEAVAGLRAAGHRGEIIAIARRGRRPERGMVEAPPPFGDFEAHRPRTAVALLRHFRSEVRRAEAGGLTWRSVAVAVRAHGWDIWMGLTPTEKHRFARHLRPFWEALRHVMPGRVHDRLIEEEQRGSLTILTASLRGLEADADGLHATLHRRGAAENGTMIEPFNVVLNCTGPAYATLTQADPFWAGLARQGLVRADGIGLGIGVDPRARALDARGEPQADLLVLGTLARGTFGELTGVSELSRLAREAAQALVETWTSAEATPEIASSS